jgi:hypothetical protein
MWPIRNVAANLSESYAWRYMQAPSDNLDEYRQQRRPAPDEYRPVWQRPTRPEHRWPAFLAVAVIIAGQSWVAGVLRVRPVWIYPVVAGILVIASLAIYLPSRQEPPRALRYLSLSLTGLLVLASMAVLVLLVHGVFVGPELTAGRLLLTGIIFWAVNIAVFALIFWELDGNGPEARAKGEPDYPDLVFPQQQRDQEGLAPPDWKPMFADYLFTSLNTAAAFSPTEAMPYSRWAKLVMGMESVISLATIALIVARAINIATG